MIVVDSSALLAIYLNEPENVSFAQTVVSAEGSRIGAPNFLEASIVAETRHGGGDCRELDRITGDLAGLNFGDCCAYALAKTLNVPLLFKGNDFALTDLKRAL